MRPVSARFLSAVNGSARVTTRARVVAAGLNGVTLVDGDVLAILDVVDGAVTLDSTAAVRGVLDLTTTAAFWPVDATSPLTPYGHEILVETGVVYGDGSREYVSQGYYRIDSVEQQDAPMGTVAVAGSDRMQGLIDARIPSPLSFPAGEAVTSVIESLVSDVYPWAVFDFDDALTGVTLASAQVTTDDRAGFLSTLVTSYGMIAFWDYRGVLVVKPPPDPSEIVVTLKTGEGGVVTSLSRTLARDSVYNAVVASGEQLDDTIPPVSAIVVDDDPTSPTYYSGDFGHVPQFFTSSFLTTPVQCVSAATSLLQQSTGLPYNVDFGQASNFALEPLDPILLRYPGRREQHVLSQLVIPLNAATAQTAQTRQLVRGTFS